MNVLHMKYALEVAKTGSLNKAAANLFVGQPNLSRAIKDLEASLGITIFDRSSKGMILTPEGEVFLDYAEKILRQIDEVEQIYREGANEAKIRQRFSVYAPRAGYISAAFSAFSSMIDRSRPSELEFREATVPEVIRGVLNSECKLGILRFPIESEKYYRELTAEKNLLCETVADFNCVLSFSTVHPFSRLEEISPELLCEHTEAIFANESFAPAQGTISVAGVTVTHPVPPLEYPEPKHKILVYDRAGMLELLHNNPDVFAWTGPTPKQWLEHHGLAQKACRGIARKYKDLLIFKSDYRLSSLDKMFITELTKYKRAWIE